MSIEGQGFLSPEIAASIDKHRTENRAWFNLAMDLNSLALQLWLEVPSMIAQQSLPEAPSEEKKRSMRRFCLYVAYRFRLRRRRIAILIYVACK
jgi:hypothetical protein